MLNTIKNITRQFMLIRMELLNIRKYTQRVLDRQNHSAIQLLRPDDKHPISRKFFASPSSKIKIEYKYGKWCYI